MTASQSTGSFSLRYKSQKKCKSQRELFFFPVELALLSTGVNKIDPSHSQFAEGLSTRSPILNHKIILPMLRARNFSINKRVPALLKKYHFQKMHFSSIEVVFYQQASTKSTPLIHSYINAIFFFCKESLAITQKGIVINRRQQNRPLSITDM